MEESSKTYFTEINENEKRVINLMRSYMAPRGKEMEFVDNIVSDLIAELYSKSVRLKAFVTVMEDPENKNRTPLEIISITNKFTDFLHDDKLSHDITTELILADIVKNLEGELKPICNVEDITGESALKEEEKILDKLNN